jgi:hypothetical protein
MAEYPDWVMKHKTKGTYVNTVNGKYYLYAAHSERVPGTKKVRRVSDGYIGRITEEGGLIPARDKVAGEVEVHEYGLCMAMLALCGDIAKGFRREFRGAADRVVVAGILAAAYGGDALEDYRWSYLSVKFPGLDMAKAPTEKQRVAIDRCERMARDVMQRCFGDGAGAAARRLSRVLAVNVNGRLYLAKANEETGRLLASLGVDRSVGNG